MKADLSRSTFDRTNHYKRVPLQQGRAQTDADANEQQAIALHRVETEAADVIGGCGGPLHDAGFEITASGSDLAIGAGRYYVDGVLCENEGALPYSAQPDYPLTGDPVAAGTYFAYLDVWERHLTALEAPHIREVALGGPDTATRTKALWQVKLHPLTEAEVEAGPDCLTKPPSWVTATAASTGELGAHTAEASASDDPCVVAPGAGYRRLENQLYRVEVHEGGTRNAATYKWDRDNGSIVARLEQQSGAADEEWTVSSVGRDATLRFAPGDWAELTDDTHELLGLPGTLVRVDGVEGNVLTMDLSDPLPAGGSIDGADFPRNPKVRRWNGVLRGVTNQNYLDLEDGVQVRLRGGNDADGLPRHYRTGDYWTIPARTNTGDVEWPTVAGGDPEWLLADGIRHHYCRLALLLFTEPTDGDPVGWTVLSDCRRFFPPVTELTSLFYVGGDGQEGTPGAELPLSLRVGVANGMHPVEGARVRFTVMSGNAEIAEVSEALLQRVLEVDTDGDGLAECFWSPEEAPLTVEAALLDAAGDPAHLPVRFGAQFGADAVEPGVHVVDVRFDTGDTLRNDAAFPVALLARGITVECDADIEPAVVRAPGSNTSKPVCFVTLYLPYPLSAADVELWGQPVIGTRPLRLEAQLAVDDNEISWSPTDLVRNWLNGQLFQILEKLQRGDRVLAYLTLKGDVIWAEDDRGTPHYLDGNALGALRDDGGTDLLLPSGDRRRGGDFELWFWLVPGETGGTPRISFEPEGLRFGPVPLGGFEDQTLTVFNSGNAPLNVGTTAAPTVFAVVSAATFTVQPGGSEAMRIRFTPNELGAVSGQLTLSSNDPDAPQLLVPMRGVAEEPDEPLSFVQFIHNFIRPDSIDVRLGGRTLGLRFREATPFLEFPAGEVEVEVAGLVEPFRLNLEPGRHYVLITCATADGPLTVLVVDDARREAPPNQVEAFIANGFSEAVDVVRLVGDQPELLARGLGGCSVAVGEGRTRYFAFDPRPQTLEAQRVGQPLAGVVLDLRGHAGRTFVLLVSGPRDALALIGFDGDGARIPEIG